MKKAYGSKLCARPSIPSSAPRSVQRDGAHKLTNVLGYVPKDDRRE